jgi:hypothetical protein
MSDYHRTTRECLVSQLQPQLLYAIRNYFQENQLGDPEIETQLCCETLSEKKHTGQLTSWLSGKSDTTIYVGMLLTSQTLIWVRSGDQSGTLLTAADLKDIQVKTYISILAHDDGLEVTGYTRNSLKRIRGYIGMGVGPATQNFCEAVEQAVAKANPQPKSFFAKWLGN